MVDEKKDPKKKVIPQITQAPVQPLASSGFSILSKTPVVAVLLINFIKKPGDILRLSKKNIQIASVLMFQHEQESALLYKREQVLKNLQRLKNPSFQDKTIFDSVKEFIDRAGKMEEVEKHDFLMPTSTVASIHSNSEQSNNWTASNDASAISKLESDISFIAKELESMPSSELSKFFAQISSGQMPLTSVSLSTNLNQSMNAFTKEFIIITQEMSVTSNEKEKGSKKDSPNIQLTNVFLSTLISSFVSKIREIQLHFSSFLDFKGKAFHSEFDDKKDTILTDLILEGFKEETTSIPPSKSNFDASIYSTITSEGEILLEKLSSNPIKDDFLLYSSVAGGIDFHAVYTIPLICHAMFKQVEAIVPNIISDGTARTSSILKRFSEEKDHIQDSSELLDVSMNNLSMSSAASTLSMMLEKVSATLHHDTNNDKSGVPRIIQNGEISQLSSISNSGCISISKLLDQSLHISRETATSNSIANHLESLDTIQKVNQTSLFSSLSSHFDHPFCDGVEEYVDRILLLSEYQSLSSALNFSNNHSRYLFAQSQVRSLVDLIPELRIVLSSCETINLESEIYSILEAWLYGINVSGILLPNAAMTQLPLSQLSHFRNLIDSDVFQGEISHESLLVVKKVEEEALLKVSKLLSNWESISKFAFASSSIKAAVQPSAKLPLIANSCFLLALNERTSAVASQTNNIAASSGKTQISLPSVSPIIPPTSEIVSEGIDLIGLSKNHSDFEEFSTREAAQSTLISQISHPLRFPSYKYDPFTKRLFCVVRTMINYESNTSLNAAILDSLPTRQHHLINSYFLPPFSSTFSQYMRSYSKSIPKPANTSSLFSFVNWRANSEFENLGNLYSMDRLFFPSSKKISPNNHSEFNINVCIGMKSSSDGWIRTTQKTQQPDQRIILDIQDESFSILEIIGLRKFQSFNKEYLSSRSDFFEMKMKKDNQDSKKLVVEEITAPVTNGRTSKLGNRKRSLQQLPPSAGEETKEEVIRNDENVVEPKYEVVDHSIFNTRFVDTSRFVVSTPSLLDVNQNIITSPLRASHTFPSGLLVEARGYSQGKLGEFETDEFRDGYNSPFLSEILSKLTRCEDKLNFENQFSIGPHVMLQYPVSSLDTLNEKYVQSKTILYSTPTNESLLSTSNIIGVKKGSEVVRFILSNGSVLKQQRFILAPNGSTSTFANTLVWKILVITNLYLADGSISQCSSVYCFNSLSGALAAHASISSLDLIQPEKSTTNLPETNLRMDKWIHTTSNGRKFVLGSNSPFPRYPIDKNGYEELSPILVVTDEDSTTMTRTTTRSDLTQTVEWNVLEENTYKRRLKLDHLRNNESAPEVSCEEDGCDIEQGEVCFSRKLTIHSDGTRIITRSFCKSTDEISPSDSIIRISICVEHPEFPPVILSHAVSSRLVLDPFSHQNHHETKRSVCLHQLFIPLASDCYKLSYGSLMSSSSLNSSYGLSLCLDSSPAPFLMFLSQRLLPADFQKLSVDEFKFCPASLISVYKSIMGSIFVFDGEGSVSVAPAGFFESETRIDDKNSFKKQLFNSMDNFRYPFYSFKANITAHSVHDIFDRNKLPKDVLLFHLSNPPLRDVIETGTFTGLVSPMQSPRMQARNSARAPPVPVQIKKNRLSFAFRPTFYHIDEDENHFFLHLHKTLEEEAVEGVAVCRLALDIQTNDSHHGAEASVPPRYYLNGMGLQDALNHFSQPHKLFVFEDPSSGRNSCLYAQKSLSRRWKKQFERVVNLSASRFESNLNLLPRQQASNLLSIMGNKFSMENWTSSCIFALHSNEENQRIHSIGMLSNWNSPFTALKAVPLKESPKSKVLKAKIFISRTFRSNFITSQDETLKDNSFLILLQAYKGWKRKFTNHLWTRFLKTMFQIKFRANIHQTSLVSPRNVLHQTDFM